MVPFSSGFEWQEVVIYLSFMVCGVIALFACLRSTLPKDDDDFTTVGGEHRTTRGPDDFTPPERFPESMYEMKSESDQENEFKCVNKDKLDADMAAMMECFANSGVVGVKKYLEETVDQWKDVPLRIGVTGRSGVGKSTFINTMRGVTAESKYAAETGTTETTMDVTEYPHPQNKKLVFCDLPGVGTDNFPRSTYLTDQKIGFSKYDMFIILTSSRIYEDDIWLAQAAKEQEKSYFFIRTQIDIEIDKEKRAKPNTFKANPNAAEKDVVDRLRSNLETSLVKGGVFEKDRVFLIDCTDLTWRRFDFERLMTRVVTGFPALKREAFLMTLKAKTPALIKEKVKVLRERVFNKSLLSALGGAVPIPGLSFVVDASIIVSEAFMYREQLCLTEKQLIEVAKESGVDINVIKKTLHLKTLDIVWTGAGIVNAFSAAVLSESIEETSKFVLPIIGSIISGSISYASTQFILFALLDMLESDALALEKYLRVRVSKV